MKFKAGTRVSITARNHSVDGCEGVVIGPGESSDTVRVTVAMIHAEVVPCHVAWLTELPAETAEAEEGLRGELYQLLLAYTFSRQPEFWALFQQFDDANKKVVLDVYGTAIHELISMIVVAAKKYA